MTQVWVGLAKTLDFEHLISKYIDPLFSGPLPFSEEAYDENAIALLVEQFGANRFEPGSFEVYARSDCQEEVFDAALFQKLSPFPQTPEGLTKLGLVDAACMFFVMCEEQPTKMSDGEVTITDVLRVKFDWES